MNLICITQISAQPLTEQSNQRSSRRFYRQRLLMNEPKPYRALANALDYELQDLARELKQAAGLPERIPNSEIRAYVETAWQQEKIVAAHYQPVDGTSFAARLSRRLW